MENRKKLLGILTVFLVIFLLIGGITYAYETIDLRGFCFRGFVEKEEINNSTRYNFSVKHCNYIENQTGG